VVSKSSIAVYFIPGTQCDERLWDTVRALLPREIRTIYLSIPRAESATDTVQAMAQLLPPSPAFIVGFSMGGYLAASLACRFPERVSRLLVLSNSPQGLSDRVIEQREQHLKHVLAGGKVGLTCRGAKRLMHSANREREDLVALMRAMARDCGRDQFIWEMRTMTRRESLVTALGRIRVSVDYVYGEEDSLVDARVLERLATQSSLINVEAIPCAGHMLPLEHPEAVVRKLMTWLDI